MRDFNELKVTVRMFMQEKNIVAYDLLRIARHFCCCNTCKHYVPHYSKDGTPLDWGHCDKGNIQHSKKPSTASCGFWADE